MVKLFLLGLERGRRGLSMVPSAESIATVISSMVKTAPPSFDWLVTESEFLDEFEMESGILSKRNGFHGYNFPLVLLSQAVEVNDFGLDAVHLGLEPSYALRLVD